jgi:tRNA-2-methylthio-N6-dimethylallyladenosine synthase
MEQVDEAVKSERLTRLQTLLKEQQADFNKSVIGTVMPVLVENTGKIEGTVFGRSPYMQAVRFTVGNKKIEELQGKIVNVEIREASAFNIQGVLA